MIATVKKLTVGLSLLSLVAGCMGVRVLSSTSDGVDRIPSKIALYPLLSTPVGKPVGRWSPATLSVRREKMGDNVVISPPAETDMQITQESQIVTGLISTMLSAVGFSLKELPVEVLPKGEKDKSSRFVISVNLLEQLREQYDLRTLVIGTAFFIVDHSYGPSGRRITSAHLKVIDVETLDVLGQVTVPYSTHGEDLNEVSEKLALALADMAGLAVE
jgi:hypothetical protein